MGEKKKVPLGEATFMDILLGRVETPKDDQPPYEPLLNEEGRARQKASINEGRESQKALKEMGNIIDKGLGYAKKTKTKTKVKEQRNGRER